MVKNDQNPPDNMPPESKGMPASKSVEMKDMCTTQGMGKDGMMGMKGMKMPMSDSVEMKGMCTTGGMAMMKGKK